MGKLESLKIRFNKKEPVIYHAGSTISGELHLVVKETIRPSECYMSFRGEGSTNWMNKTSEKVFSTKQTYLNEAISLDDQLKQICSFDESIGVLELAAGSYHFSFSVTLPRTLPSSFTGECGLIHYTATAVIEKSKPGFPRSPQAFLKSIGHSSNAYIAEESFGVIADVDVLSYKEKLQIADFHDAEATSCCCLPAGNITVSLSLPKTAFAIGERISLNAHVFNHSFRTTVPKVAAKLMQTIQFYGQSDFLETEETKEFDFLMVAIEKDTISPGQDQTWDDVELSTEQLLPSQQNCAVNIRYTLKFDVEKGPMIEVPIYIATHSSLLGPPSRHGSMHMARLGSIHQRL